MATVKQPFHELLNDIQIYPQLNVNVPVSDKKKAHKDPVFQAAIQSIAQALGEEGRVIVRESGTEPLLRLMVEAKNDSICQNYINQLMNVLTAKGYTE